MIKDIEVHCEDVICLTQNFLQISPEQFDTVCNQQEVELIVKQTETQLVKKQEQLHRDILEDADDSSESEDSYDSEDLNALRQTVITTAFNSAAGASLQTTSPESEEETKTLHSYRSDFSASLLQNQLERPKCVDILKLVIAIKREQTFCQQADKEIFLTSDRSLFSSSSQSSACADSSSETGSTSE